MTSIISFFQLFLILNIARLSLSLVQSPIEYCTPSSRYATCPSEFTGVWAYSFGINCEPFECVTFTANECTACLNPLVSSFTREEIKADKVYCDPDFRPQICANKVEPVCAYTSNEDLITTYYGKTRKNGCKACRDPGVEYYIPGGECAQKNRRAYENTEDFLDEEDEVEMDLGEEILQALKKLETIINMIDDYQRADVSDMRDSYQQIVM